MRIGTTSYIIPADILTNVRWLAGKVQDVEVVIFQCDDPGTDLPDRSTVAELIRISSQHDLTYTVHLPLDLRLVDDEQSIRTALRVIQATRDLGPVAYVVHLDGNADRGSVQFRRWVENSCECLYRLGEKAGSLDLLCVENLDGQSPVMIDAILDRIPVSCCIDVGHLWKQALDPLPCLDAWFPRCRVVHIHGMDHRDHKALSLMSEEALDPVIGKLVGGFEGVLTLEVFTERDLEQSLAALHGSIRRVSNRSPLMI